MRHMARRKKPKLNSFTNINKLLHSIIKSKSTYFYSNDGELSDSKSSSHNFTNGLRVRLSSLRENSEFPEVPSAIQTRRSPNSKSPYSKITGWRTTTYVLPSACALALLLVMGLAINPIVSGNEEKVYAVYEPVTSTTGVSLLMETSDALEQQTQVANGVTAYRYNRFKVNKGTDIDKYQVLVQAANGYDSTLVGAENGQVVNAVNGATKGSAMDSAWGYSLAEGAITNTDSLANLEYQALPGSGSTNTNATPYTETKEFTLAFAANIKDKPADHYQTNVLLSVAAGAEQVVTELGFNGITEMQQMTSNVCKSAADGLEGRLKDTRDNKVYWIGKLKDGNCWMTQNLDLDLNQANLLTPSNSDVSSNWPSTALSDTMWAGSSDYDLPNYYDPGDYYYTTPDTRNQCISNTTGLSACINNGWKLNATNADFAEFANIIDVTEWTPTYDTYFVNAVNYVGTDGQSICDKTSGSIFGDSKYSQCRIYYNGDNYGYSGQSKLNEHYHVGNYYSWGAATAGQASYITGDSVERESMHSICPKGWRLPPNSGDRSYASLFEAYGALVSLKAGAQDIRLGPLYFVYGGNTYSKSLNGAGSVGNYWSSTATGGASNAYLMMFSDRITVSNGMNRNMGYSVRCVAR